MPHEWVSSEFSDYTKSRGVDFLRYKCQACGKFLIDARYTDDLPPGPNTRVFFSYQHPLVTCEEYLALKVQDE
jgi:hypothetical protein